MSEDPAAIEISPWSVKRKYQKVFGIPKNDWTVEADWERGYFDAAAAIIRGVAERRYLPGVEGVAGLYLFRHYLEIALKYIIFKARWLETTDRNARRKDIADVQRTHSLGFLWQLAKTEARPKIKGRDWESWDISYVNKCIAEFDQVDPDPGYRFRYFGKTFGIQHDASPAADRLYVSFERLAEQMEHVRHVLFIIDTYLHETWGENHEWEAILDSY